MLEFSGSTTTATSKVDKLDYQSNYSSGNMDFLAKSKI